MFYNLRCFLNELNINLKVIMFKCAYSPCSSKLVSQWIIFKYRSTKCYTSRFSKSKCMKHILFVDAFSQIHCLGFRISKKYKLKWWILLSFLKQFEVSRMSQLLCCKTPA